MKNKFGKFVFVAMILQFLWIVCSLALLGAAIYVAVHFIQKWW